MRLYVLSLRNLLRKPKRTGLTLATIIVSLSTLMILGGYYEYNYWGLRESFIRSQLAHIQVYPKAYLDNRDVNPYRYSLPQDEAFLEFFDSLAEVQIASPRVIYWAVLEGSEDASELIEVRGVIPERENLVNTFFTYKRGHDLSSRFPHGAELGKSLAESLNVRPGDDFFLSVVQESGAHNYDSFTARSVIGSYSSEFDARILRIPMEAAQHLAGFYGYQELVLLLSKDAAIAEVVAVIQARAERAEWDLHVTTWEEHAGYYAQVVSFYGGYFKIIFIIVGVLSFFSIFNALLMAYFERITELGTLRSFGMPQSVLVRIMLLEGVWLGIAGTLGAYVCTLVLAAVTNAVGGIPMPPPPGLTTSVDVMIRLTPNLFVTSAALGICISVFASILPICKTLSMSIMDQIHYNEA